MLAIISPPWLLVRRGRASGFLVGGSWGWADRGVTVAGMDG